jgi:UDP-N-acetylglucosamine diphosphorylase/glucosamine-1-phosphate N-acetyltransferase
MHLCLYEDIVAGNFFPLIYFRPVYDLRCGILTLREKALRYLVPTRLTLYVREYLAPYLHEENPRAAINEISSDACLFLNGRCIMTKGLAKVLRKEKQDALFMVSGEVVGARLSGANLARSRSELHKDALDLSALTGLPHVEVDAALVRYPWDLVYANESEIAGDFLLLTGRKAARNGDVHKSAVLLGKKYVAIGKKSRVGPGTVLDAEAGPIYIGSGVRVFPHAVIEGPCFVGDGSIIKAGAQIYGKTSIGPVCKIGGEVEQSIFHSHSNKQHHGFVGHSYLAPWVNLGAGTTTSDLKNTYGTVKVHVGGRPVDSGRMFVGLTAADHVKTGINATLDTGTVIGPSSNVYGTSLPPKFVPAFTWGSPGQLTTYDVERALAVATTMMARRNVQLTPAYREVFRNVFSMTNNERSSQRA